MKKDQLTTIESAAAVGEFHEAAQQDTKITRTAKNAGIIGLIGFSSALAIHAAAAPQDDQPMAPLPDKAVKGGLVLGLLGVGASLGAAATRRRERSEVKRMSDDLRLTSSTCTPTSELSHPPLAKDRYVLRDGTVLLPPEGAASKWTEVTPASTNGERLR